jgi:hypothetical protein
MISVDKYRQEMAEQELRSHIKGGITQCDKVAGNTVWPHLEVVLGLVVHDVELLLMTGPEVLDGKQANQRGDGSGRRAHGSGQLVERSSQEGREVGYMCTLIGYGCTWGK